MRSKQPNTPVFTVDNIIHCFLMKDVSKWVGFSPAEQNQNVISFLREKLAVGGNSVRFDFVEEFCKHATTLLDGYLKNWNGYMLKPEKGKLVASAKPKTASLPPPPTSRFELHELRFTDIGVFREAEVPLTVTKLTHAIHLQGSIVFSNDKQWFYVIVNVPGLKPHENHKDVVKLYL